MKARMILVIVIVLFLTVGIGASIEESDFKSEDDLIRQNLLQEFKMAVAEAYWEGYNELSCRELKVSLIAEVVMIFMENPHLCPQKVSYVAIALEDSCETGKCDREFGENNLDKWLEVLESEMKMRIGGL